MAVCSSTVTGRRSLPRGMIVESESKHLLDAKLDGEGCGFGASIFRRSSRWAVARGAAGRS